MSTMAKQREQLYMALSVAGCALSVASLASVYLRPRRRYTEEVCLISLISMLPECGSRETAVEGHCAWQRLSFGRMFPLPAMHAAAVRALPCAALGAPEGHLTSIRMHADRITHS